MKLTFYTIPKIFIDNASFLGSITAQLNEDINVNMSNISKVSILLPSNYINYNYIKIQKDNGDYYYYKLLSWSYYIEAQTTFHYEIDILRTLSERDMLNHDVSVQRYSNLLEMSKEQSNYFWRTQDTKLSSNVKDEYIDTQIVYSKDPNIQKAWANTKWVYVWLQPKIPSTVKIDNLDQNYQYTFTKRAAEEIITVNKSYINLSYVAYKGRFNSTVGDIKIYPSTNNPVEDLRLGTELYYGYPVNQLYYVEAENKYYRFIEYTRTNTSAVIGVETSQTFRKFTLVSDYTYGMYDETKYYMINLPAVAITDVPNSLYCMVLPTEDIQAIRQIGNATVKKLWSANEVLPYLFDVNSENTWGEFIVDIKISVIPPFDLNDPDAQVRVINGEPALYIPYTVPGSNFDPVKALFERSIATNGLGEKITNPLFLPVLRYKPNMLHKLKSNFVLPEVSKETTVYKKYLLSIVEQRVELDLPLLKTDFANTLYYYEEISPGRTNALIGFGPNINSKDTIYYLLHSPSALFITRDSTLPTFTSNYQTYLANNKNFIQQAELQRNSDLAQSLIQQSSTIVGAGVVQSQVKGYSSAGAVAGGVAGAINAGIKYGVSKQNFNWMVDNYKSAPGNFKSASATLMFMLNLDVYRVWLEVYRSNDFDIALYENNIMNIGYDYSLFRYNLKEIISNVFIGTLDKKYLQGTLTGLTNQSLINIPLLLILQDQLESGINIMI